VCDPWGWLTLTVTAPQSGPDLNPHGPDLQRCDSRDAANGISAGQELVVCVRGGLHQKAHGCSRQSSRWSRAVRGERGRSGHHPGEASCGTASCAGGARASGSDSPAGRCLSQGLLPTLVLPTYRPNCGSAHRGCYLRSLVAQRLQKVYAQLLWPYEPPRMSVPRSMLLGQGGQPGLSESSRGSSCC
jgi:hypothetical protein